MTFIASLNRFVTTRRVNAAQRAEARAERRAEARSRAYQFHGLEQLEPRMLLSATVPAGFVEVGQYTINTSSATPVVTAALTPGADYFAVASGTFKVGGSASHIADAEYHKHPTKGWKDLTTLLPRTDDMGLDDASGRLGHWDGDLSTPSIHERATDAVYGQAFTADSAAPLELFYNDVAGEGPNGPGSTWYDDNVGSLMVKLYQEVVLDKLIVSEPRGEETEVVTASTTSTTPTLELEWNDTGTFEVTLDRAVTPDTANGVSKARYHLETSSGLYIDDGSLATPALSLVFNDQGEREFRLYAGVDANANNFLEPSERTRTVELVHTGGTGGGYSNQQLQRHNLLLRHWSRLDCACPGPDESANR